MNVLCVGGHFGQSVIGYITDLAPLGVICSDGGIGKNNSGIAGLPVVGERIIPGATVSAATARVGDGQSTYFDGVISAANDLARRKG